MKGASPDSRRRLILGSALINALLVVGGLALAAGVHRARTEAHRINDT